MFKFDDFDIIDASGYRASVSPFDEFLNRQVFSLGDDFNSTIGKVLGAAFYREMFSLVLGK